MNTENIIIDVGGCVGVFTDDCLRRFEVGRVFVFEPLRANYDFLVDKYGGDERVEVIDKAVSNFNGVAHFFKKPQVKRVLGVPVGREFDFVGNAGSSLKNKSNVSLEVSDEVEVVSLADFLVERDLQRVDILKIDSEGSEYDILLDLLERGLMDGIERVYFEDHVRKVPEIVEGQREFVQQVRGSVLEEKFFVQNVVTGDDLAYMPLREAYDADFFTAVK